MSKKKHRGWPEVPTPLSTPVIDNHTHLPIVADQIPRRRGVRLTLDAQLARAKTVGVSDLITSACALPDMTPTIDMVRRYSGRADCPRLYVATAIHPNEAALHAGVVEKSPDGLEHDLDPHHQRYNLEQAINYVADIASASPQVVAIGETGLDYFRTGDAGRQAQQRSFAGHIALAKELDLPMQIHDRDAHADTVDLLHKCGAPRLTVFHCFSGDKQLAKVAADNGWYASFSGTLTFKPNDHLRQALAVIPRELVMVETDAPYLTPHPHRGQPNASYMIAHTVRFIAQQWGLSEDATIQILNNNTRTVYNLHR